MALRITSSLNHSDNDTGRTAWCGPTIVSAITGYPISRVEEEIWRVRGRPDESDKGRAVKGTYDSEVREALAQFGYAMDLAQDYKHLEIKRRPSVWTWMQRPRNAWVHYVLGIHKGRRGHWILIKGVKMCDTYTGGAWMFVCDGPHKGARIMDIHTVRKSSA
jgi:hypothetical protein